MSEAAKSSVLRVLVAEDESLIALLLEDMLAELGYECVGPASTLDDALLLAKQGEIEAAILDVDLRGQKTYPVADLLTERGIPVMFATGYDIGDLEDRFTGIPVLQKPFAKSEVGRVLASVIGYRGS
jgi:CheY-like chemotaxis protein